MAFLTCIRNLSGSFLPYMYGGKWIRNKSHAMGSGDEFRVGPHIMIIGLDQKVLHIESGRIEW
jgi:hypothetical protein